ncbi:hypothetical protein EV06_1452 [Prochlorococcus sp. MIT 0602]|nr:hypothetical protein EV06_1452 [Prochlorococcus sp. MIT 0602]KGG17858.1 hypothetical protein EV07_1300 [Prochlorococcus sp. MIT 0603]
MSNEEIKDFVKTILEDQIKGTVGNEEEREAWKEMKDFFKNEFNQQIELVKQKCPSSIDLLADPKQDESDRRMELLEKRKEENEQKVKDMW